MSEQFDPEQLAATGAAMQELERRCETILVMLGGKKTISRFEQSEVSVLYLRLKEDLKAASKYGTLDGKRRPRTRAEECFYDPAVRRAHIDLRPKTNSHPISGRWFSAVFEAKSEFSYWLHNMQGLPGAPELGEPQKDA